MNPVSEAARVEGSTEARHTARQIMLVPYAKKTTKMTAPSVATNCGIPLTLPAAYTSTASTATTTLKWTVQLTQ